jgi:FkbM family methyltransferase
MSVFLSSLKKSGHLDCIHITIGNVGSRKLSLEDDYAEQGWGIFAPQLSIYGFDADADACAFANADLENRRINWTEHHVPLALGKVPGEATLYVTQDPMCSSLYPPNESYLARFRGLSELVNLDFTVGIETTTLDEFCQVEALAAIDFLQVDVQGADLDVLKGAEKLLSTTLAVQTEVEFSSLYLNQPLFADTDVYLRNHGFTLFDLTMARRARARSPIASVKRQGQLLWGDAFYLRDLLQEDKQATPEQIFKLACVADALDFSDYALELLEHLTLKYGSDSSYNFADTILGSLSQVSDLDPQRWADLPVVQSLQKYVKTFVFETIPTDSSVILAQTPDPPQSLFRSDQYLQHNQRRLEHLASLNLDLANKTVLEVGAGIGDHTHFFLDRRCQIMPTEGRPENLELLQSRYPSLPVRLLDMDNPDPTLTGPFDIVYCYGLLYHLKHPLAAIEFMSNVCQGLLLLETCVSYGEEAMLHPCPEWAESPSQAISGQGCRPTRHWVYRQLKQYFDFVYLPVTQPNHEEFPLDWSVPVPDEGLTRAVFIASRKPLNNSLLAEELLMQQRRH